MKRDTGLFVDWLTVGGWGRWSAKGRGVLEALQAQAWERGAPFYVKGEPWQFKGFARRYAILEHPAGPQLEITKGDVGSAPLVRLVLGGNVWAQQGPRAWREGRELLAWFGMTTTRVARVDVAADFVTTEEEAPSSEWMRLAVTRANAAMHGLTSAGRYGVVHAVTVGRRGREGTYLRIYDKKKEAQVSGKADLMRRLWDARGLHWRAGPVWRVEVEAGAERLDKLGVRAGEAWPSNAACGRLWAYATDGDGGRLRGRGLVRFTTDGTRKGAVMPFWAKVQAAGPGAWELTEEAERELSAERAAPLWKQAAGCIVAALMHEGRAVDDVNARARAWSVIGAELRRRAANAEEIKADHEALARQALKLNEGLREVLTGAPAHQVAAYLDADRPRVEIETDAAQNGENAKKLDFEVKPNEAEPSLGARSLAMSDNVRYVKNAYPGLRGARKHRRDHDTTEAPLHRPAQPGPPRRLRRPRRRDIKRDNERLGAGLRRRLLDRLQSVLLLQPGREL